MRFLHLTLLYCVLNFFSSDSALKYPSSSPTKILKSNIANPATTNNVEAGATDILFQSKDGGQTWEDISHSLPENELPLDLFAGESEVYLHVENGMYSSKSNLRTPLWEKEIVLDPQSTSIGFNHSGVMAYNNAGQIYQRVPGLGTWLPIYTNSKKYLMRSVFETSEGTVLLSCDNGLYKSADKGQSWKQVQNEVRVTDIVESEGVLIGKGQKGIMRSTDNGEHWQWVISEGGVGIEIEQIKGGFAAITYNTITKTRRIRISMDKGKTWQAIDEGLRPSLSIASIKQVGEYLLCGHPDGIFRSADMGKTWNIVHSKFNASKTPSNLDFTVDKKVFKLYVSGNIVYALLKNAGC